MRGSERHTIAGLLACPSVLWLPPPPTAGTYTSPRSSHGSIGEKNIMEGATSKRKFPVAPLAKNIGEALASGSSAAQPTVPVPSASQVLVNPWPEKREAGTPFCPSRPVSWIRLPSFSFLIGRVCARVRCAQAGWESRQTGNHHAREAGSLGRIGRYLLGIKSMDVCLLGLRERKKWRTNRGRAYVSSPRVQGSRGNEPGR